MRFAFTARVRHIASLAIPIAVTAVAAAPSAARASTVAYWRFEGDGTTAPTDGTFLQDTNGRSAVQAAGLTAVDASGNGNTLYTWDNNATGHQYRAVVPAGTALRSGLTNSFSVKNNGSFPASFTWSAQAGPGGTNVDTITPGQWTIEASVRADASALGNNFRTFVGREGNGLPGLDANLAPVYFQKNNANRVQISFADQGGNFWTATDPTAIAGDAWYHFAAVSDGLALKLYKDALDGTGYQLVATTDISGSSNSAMVDPGTDLNGDAWGWTIGRGRYGTNDDPTQNHVDRWLGYVDEVRISDSALATNQFLFTTPSPEPGTVSLLTLAAGPVLLRRRRK